MRGVIFLRRRQPAAERFRTLLCLRYRSPPIDMARGAVISEFHQESVGRSPRYAPGASHPRPGPPIEGHIPAGQNPEAEAIRHIPAPSPLAPGNRKSGGRDPPRCISTSADVGKDGSSPRSAISSTVCALRKVETGRRFAEHFFRYRPTIASRAANGHLVQKKLSVGPMPVIRSTRSQITSSCFSNALQVRPSI